MAKAHMREKATFIVNPLVTPQIQWLLHSDNNTYVYTHICIIVCLNLMRHSLRVRFYVCLPRVWLRSSYATFSCTRASRMSDAHLLSWHSDKYLKFATCKRQRQSWTSKDIRGRHDLRWYPTRYLQVDLHQHTLSSSQTLHPTAPSSLFTLAQGQAYAGTHPGAGIG